ncbi:TPA: NTPase, partial [Klebsiella pneumoniae]|nr:NTPase [Klebsiella pneumoniae]
PLQKNYTDSMDEPREWVRKAIQTNQGFATMVTRLMSRGTSHTYGDRVSTQHNSFNKETIDDFIGIEVAKAKCDAINPAQFPEHEEALRTLLKYLEKWLGLREKDMSDF